MKITVNIQTLNNALSKIKKATSMAKVERVVLLVAEENKLTISGRGGVIYAETTIPTTVHKTGAVVMPLDSFNAFSYVDGEQTFELKKNKMVTKGVINGSLSIHSIEPDFYQKPKEPETRINVGNGVFNILYAMDAYGDYNAVFAQGNIFACGDRRSFAGYHNEESVGEEQVTILPELLNTVGKNEFEFGVAENQAWIYSDDMEVSAPLLQKTNPHVITFGYWEELGKTWFKTSRNDLVKLANVMHALSVSERFENGDGRGCLLLNDKLTGTAAGNQIGDGSLTVEVEEKEGEFNFGVSTKMLKNAIMNTFGEIYVYMPTISDNQVIIVVDENTRHFIAEDPVARCG